jgi:DNA-binding IclR family transcriptional regulator
VMSMLWSATGRAFLGSLHERAVLAMAQEELAHASPGQRALLDAKEPIEALRRSVRTAGCAAVRDTNLPGISAVSTPLHDHTGRVCAVLTALGASGGFDAAVDGPVAQALRREAEAISELLGYRPKGS